MAPAPTLATYCLLCLGRQSSSLDIRMRSPLSLAYFIESGIPLNDGTYTRLARFAPLTTRDCGNRCVGTNYTI